MSGHRSQLVSIVAFSVLMRSLGRFSLFHWATVALSVNKVNGSRFSVILIGTWKQTNVHISKLQPVIENNSKNSKLKMAETWGNPSLAANKPHPHKFHFKMLHEWKRNGRDGRVTAKRSVFWEMTVSSDLKCNTEREERKGNFKALDNLDNEISTFNVLAGKAFLLSPKTSNTFL